MTTQEQMPANAKVQAEVSVLPHVNLALMQNGLPVVQGLAVSNTCDEPLQDVVCAFSSEEGFIVPSQVSFREIGAKETVRRPNVDVLLNQRRVLEVTGEPAVGAVKMSVSVAGQVVFERSYPLTILAVDQWLGAAPYPELLAAYVLPNDDFVCRLQAESAVEIECMTKSASLEGYQGGKKRVLEICAAIYSTIQKVGLRYCNPPSSFGQPGQKIRLPAEIEKFKLATCIETSLLMAGVMEKCGLHPVLLLTKDHCYVGCHLVEELLEGVVVNKLQPLRKLADLDEFVAIETTMVTGNAPFNAAERAGRERLDDEDSFVCAVEVVRSRENGIRALSFGSGFASDYTAEGREVEVLSRAVRDVADSLDLSTLKQAETTQNRIARWTQKLLDFSARNRLLNIPRTSRQIIRLMCSNVGDLEDRIAADETVTIRSIEDSMGEKALDDLLNGRMKKEQCASIVDAELAHRRLCVMLPPRDVHRRLTDLLHSARTDLEESGVNTLFLTIGELQWMEPGTGASRKAYRAPILMVPVRLERPSMAEGVKMYRLDEETALNTTLIEFLRVQFNLTLPGLDPLPLDDSGVDVPRVLQIFRQAVKEKDGWEVFDEATVGCFSFGKFVMWKDMTDRVDELKRCPLVNHLVGGGGYFDDGIEVFPADEVARHFKPAELFCPVSYDSSQLTAVLYSERGKSFVLHGPPGTGKSQTITNIIAHNLAKGRRVLFVSEKKAALDVVKERLDRIGLTPFCLELHSNKTEKSRFYDQIRAALAVPEAASPAEWEQVVADLEKCRLELDGYIRALHHVYPNGLSAYMCFSRAIQGTSAPHPELIGIDCLQQSRIDYRDARQAVQELSTAFRDVSETAVKTMPAFRLEVWTPVAERQLKESAEELAAADEALLQALAELGAATSVTGPWTRPSVRTLVDVLVPLKGSAKVGRFFYEKGKATSPDLLAELTGMQARRRELERTLGAYRLEQIGELDFDGLEQRLAANARSFFLVRFFKNAALVKEMSGLLKLGAAKLTVAKLAADLPQMREYVELGLTFAEKAGCGPEELVPLAAETKDAMAKVLDRWTAFGAAFEKFLDVVEEPAPALTLDALDEMCQGLVENIGELRGVLRYRKAKTVAEARSVGAFAAYLDAYDDGSLDVSGVFDDAYAAKMLDAILARTPVLAEFTGLGQDERINRFRELDRKYTSLAKQVVYAKLAVTLPRRRNGPCPDGSELGMLKRECEKKSRQKAVRQMLAESKTLLPTLKPCFLMSPLSVAQYLPIDAQPFDLIVFDEASQIPVWDAVGVIARGRQLVVVGDPKQMPPTNFFQKGEIEDEDDDGEAEAIADQESILDECLVAGVFSTYLNWHYRSRHESLIAFSNEHYYSNKLCTFPAASSSPRLGMKFKFVPDGRFVKAGKGPRVNEIEAKALVDYICTEVRKPDYRKRSIGIVTFSQPQQELIRDLLEERLGEDPVLEKLLPEDGEGAYFVKNLENVQGDESDVILFSVGYAPDENGRFTMNFGPLNLTGGERRLNVAVTRAKEQVVVFSSIHGSQIDAGEDGRTKAVGAVHLKAFLDYAERGTTAGAPVKAGASNERFGTVVAQFLTDRGFAVERNVGCGEYRIDVAVRHPEDATRYLMGIECDGPAYAEQRTVQDRDVNRAGVLKGLGWQMCRVWSVDWAFDRARAEQRLLEALEKARTAPEKAREERLQPKAAETTKAPPPAAAPVQPTYPPYKLWTIRKNFKHDRFYDPAARPQITQLLQQVIEVEGPICEDVLRRRVAKAWGVTRMTESAQDVFAACTPNDWPKTEHEGEKVFWPQGVMPSEYRGFRVPTAEVDSRRTLEEIPPEELANAMRELLQDLGECPEDELFREVVKIFGLSVLTAKARKILVRAYALLKI